MQIYCPKCKTGYEIEADVVPEKGRRLRCAVCGKIFKCMPEDLIDGSKLRTAEFTEEEKLRLDEDGHLQDEDAEETAVEAEIRLSTNRKLTEKRPRKKVCPARVWKNWKKRRARPILKTSRISSSVSRKKPKLCLKPKAKKSRLKKPGKASSKIWV